MLDGQDGNRRRHWQKCAASNGPIKKCGETKCAENPQEQQQRIRAFLLQHLNHRQRQNSNSDSSEEAAFQPNRSFAGLQVDPRNNEKFKRGGKRNEADYCRQKQSSTAKRRKK